MNRRLLQEENPNIPFETVVWVLTKLLNPNNTLLARVHTSIAGPALWQYARITRLRAPFIETSSQRGKDEAEIEARYREPSSQRGKDETEIEAGYREPSS